MNLTSESSGAVRVLNERGRWHARETTYYAGTWAQLAGLIPRFEIADFIAQPDSQANPYMKSVVRIPRTAAERRIPVGIVSNTYSLAQHHEVIEHCFEGIRNSEVDPSDLRCELGLTELGE